MSAQVLLVDDEPEILQETADWLDLNQIVCATAKSATEAIERLDQNDEIKVVVTDLRMPSVDGFSLIRQIRERRSDDAAPRVAIVTGHLTERDYASASTLAVDAFLAKPIDPYKLLELVKSWLAS